MSKKIVRPQQSFMIAGKNFCQTLNLKKVVFANGVTAQVLNWSDTQITCVVPTGAVSGEVKVIIEGGISNGVELIVDSAVPVITPVKVPFVIPEYKPVEFQAVITDVGSGVKKAVVYWRKRIGMEMGMRTYNEIPMVTQGSDTYKAVLSGDTLGKGHYYYHFTAQDNAGNWKATQEYPFQVK